MAPSTLENVPALHAEHETEPLPPQVLPAGQLVHVREDAPEIDEYVPELQKMQIDLDVEAMELDQVPALQLAQTVSVDAVAATAMNCPNLHVVATKVHKAVLPQLWPT